jgi:hypothetical protein
MLQVGAGGGSITLHDHGRASLLASLGGFLLGRSLALPELRYAI